MTGFKTGSGPLGHGQTPDISATRHLFQNFVAQGLRVKAPTNASTIAADAHEFHLDIDWGIAVVGGTVKEFDAVADYDLSKSVSAPPADLPSGSSVVYSVVLLKSDIVRVRYFRGTPAVTGSELPITDATIEACLGDEVPAFEIGHTTINRTGAATLTQTYDNTVRPLFQFEL